MRRFTRRAVLALVVLLPLPGRGADDDTFAQPLTLAALVAYAREHNPEIRAAESRWDAARARPSQAGALPDPMVELAYHDEGFDRLRLGDTDFAFVRLGASQEVPFPGKLGLKAEAAARAADRVGEEYRRVDLEVISNLKMAYAEYAHLQELVDLLARNKSLLERLARTAEARYAVGEGIQQDVLKAQVELSLLIDRETTLAQRRESQTAQLNALLNRPPWAPLGTAEHPALKTLSRSLDELTTAAHAHAPELKAAELRIAGSESELALAHREYLPDFVVKGEYMHKSALLPEWEVGVGIKVPLYFAEKQRAGVQEATAMAAEARHMHEAASRGLDFRIKDLYLQATSSERLISLYLTTVVPQARLALESATTSYEVGRVDFLTLLNSFTVMLEYEMRYHEELSSFQKAIAQLEALVGISLED